MLRRSFTWLFSGALLLAGGVVRADSPVVCLPPVFDGGQRLHEKDSTDVYWLELLLRQHEICWRTPTRPDEVRIALAGSSAVFGHPLEARDTLSARLNEHFGVAGISAHVFNLGFATTYQLKDALIIHESLRYRPQLVIYAATLADFVHVAPLPYPIDEEFFRQNRREMMLFADERPDGLTEPLREYGKERAGPLSVLDARLGQIGALIRAAIRTEAGAVRERFLAEPAMAATPEPGASAYDCTKTKREAAASFRDWQSWNILAYLQRLRTAAGIEVLVVDWPVAYQPVDDCYNPRFPAAAVQEYNQWMAEQARLRGLAYVDLHDLLAREEFIDSLHVTADGERRIAEQLAPALDALVVKVANSAANAVLPDGVCPAAACAVESDCTNSALHDTIHSPP